MSNKESFAGGWNGRGGNLTTRLYQMPSSAVRGTVTLLQLHAFTTLTGAIWLTSYDRSKMHVLWPWRTCKTLPKDLALPQHVNVFLVFAFDPLLRALERISNLFVFTVCVFYESIEERSQISSFFSQFFLFFFCFPASSFFSYISYTLYWTI